MGRVCNWPARYESRFGSLVRSEAWRHMVVMHRLIPECDRCGFCCDAGIKGHLVEAENQIYAHIKAGFCQVLEDWSGLRFWNPCSEQFEVFREELVLIWRATFNVVEPLLSVAEFHTGKQPTISPEAKDEDYTGPAPVPGVTRTATAQDFIGAKK